MRFEQRKDGVVQDAVARDRLGARARRWIARDVGASPAGFFDEEQACRDVPRVELELPEGVETTRCDITEVQSRAAVSSNGARGFDHPSEVREVVIGALVDVVGEARGGEGVLEAVFRRDLEAAAVQGGPPSADGAIALVEERVVDDADLPYATALDPDRDAETRVAVRVVRGPVERVDDPCLLYTSPSPRDRTRSRMPSSA